MTISPVGERTAAANMRRLLSLPAFWINLDRASERQEAFFFNVEQHWKGPIARVAGVEGSDISDEEVKLFTDSRRLNDGKDVKDVYPDRTLRISRGSLGCLRGHIEAIRRGMDSGAERFVIMEDDAALRLDVLKRTSPPPDVAEFVAWGGVPMLSFRSDDERYLAGKEQGWGTLNPKSRFYGAHCYELTRNAAIVLLEIYEREDQTTDDGWHELFGKVPSFRLRTQVVTQKSGSVSMINNKARETGVVK